MKKVLCLIDGLGSGGAERQLVGLAILLKQKGYQVELVCYHKDLFCLPMAQQGDITPIVLSVKNSQWSKLMAIRRFIKSKGGFDCVISYKDGPNAIGCLLKLMGMRFKLLVSERNTTQEINGKKRLYRLYRFTDYIVPNSYSQGAFLTQNYPWMRKKLVTITNYTDIYHFSPNYKQPDGILSIMTAARLAKQKNILRYLEAISILKKKGVANVHFDWYGHVQKGEDEYGKAVMAKTKELDLEDYITFHPNVSNIIDYYQECAAFCLPSSYEGYPNVVCEAMSCGKPVLCSRVCDNGNIVKDSYNGLLFDPNNVEDIADKIEKLISMTKEEREEWGKRSRSIATELFSKESFVNKYIELIESKK